MKHKPWYRHVAGGQGRSTDEVTSLVDTLIYVLACCLVVLLILIAIT